MSADVKQWVAECLEHGGKLELASLLRTFVPVTELRALAKRFALAPKGYRIDRAPAKVLAPLLVDLQRTELLDAAVAALLAHLGPGADAATGPAEPAPADDAPRPDPLQRLRDSERTRLEHELTRARQSLDRRRRSEDELRRQLELAQERLARQHAEITALRSAQAARPGTTAADRDVVTRLHDLERELAELEEVEANRRRREAEAAARIHELEDEVAELRELVPRGRRRKRRPPPELPPMPEKFRMATFTPSYLRSLEHKSRRAAEAALRSILLFCTEGPMYPGLEVKQLEGQEIWSLRASLRLRVYFRMLDNGDIELLELVDRQDQNTALRRWKERS